MGYEGWFSDGGDQVVANSVPYTQPQPFKPLRVDDLIGIRDSTAFYRVSITSRETHLQTMQGQCVGASSPIASEFESRAL